MSDDRARHQDPMRMGLRRWTSRLVATTLVALLAACGGSGGGHDAALLKSEILPFQPVRGSLLQKADLNSAGARFTGNGWYWNPSESGTGAMFEAQGAQAVFGYYAYNDAGNPIWYSAAGAFTQTASGFAFSANLFTFEGGQPAASTTYRQPTARLVGPVSGTFTGNGADTRVTVALPGGRVLNLQRFNFADIRFAPGPMQGETGWYWNAAESGRGYGVEIQGNTFVAVMFHYREDGKPTWNAVQGDLSTGVLESAPFLRYAGGQTLTGSHKLPAGPFQDGTFGLSFPGACNGAVKLPGRSDWTLIERFAFGTDQPCRVTAAGNAFGGNLVTSATADYGLTSQERVAFTALNNERMRCGFGALKQDKRLDQASSSHLNYLALNATFGHLQTAGSPGFTGTTPSARGIAVGYGPAVTEILGFRSDAATSLQLIRGLLAGPYHALTGMGGTWDMGIGWGTVQGARTLVVNQGYPSGAQEQRAAGVVTYPCQGSAGVAALGSNESPSPFPAEAAPRWGQPILVRGSASLRVQFASLTGPTGEVPIKARYGDGMTTDPNGFCNSGWACIVPAELQPSTVYTVTVSGTDGAEAFSRSFIFKTGAE